MAEMTTMIKCPRCHKQFSVGELGIEKEPGALGKWICPQCRLRWTPEDESKRPPV